MTDLSEQQRIPASLSVSLTMTPEMQSSLRQGEGYIEVAQAYEITCHEEAQAAVSERNTCLKAIDKLESLRKGFLKPAQEIIDNAKALFNPAINGYKESVALLNTKITGWEGKERARIALENQAREEEARKARQKAEQEAAAARARAEQEAAAARAKAAEAEEARKKAKSEGNARAAAAAAAAAAKAEEQAHAALENGAAKAQAAQVAAAAISTAAAAPEVQKLAGNTMRDNWIAEFELGVDEDEAKARIAAECVARPELLALLKLDMSAANKLAKAQKGAMRVPGLLARNNPIAAGSKK